MLIFVFFKVVHFMAKYKKILISLLILFSCFSGSTLLFGTDFSRNYVAKTMEQKAGKNNGEGLSILLSPAIEVNRSKPSLETDVDRQTINSYRETTRKRSGSRVKFDFSVSYDMENWRFNLNENGLGLTWKTSYGNLTSYYNSSFGYGSGFSTEDKEQTIYEDPYLLNQKRKKTEEKLDSFSVIYEIENEIYSFEAGIATYAIDLKNDKTTEYDDLGRNSATDVIYLAGRIAYVVVGGIHIETKAKGMADSARGHEGLLLLIVPFDDETILIAGGSSGEMTFKATHPIFNKKRKDTQSTTFGSFIAPITENWSYSLDYGYEIVDSNIRFFDRQREHFSVAILYKF